MLSLIFKAAATCLFVAPWASNPLVSNYYVATPLFNRLHRLDTKMDWNAGSKLRLTGRFGFQPYNVQQVPPFGSFLAGPVQASQYGNVIATSVGITYTATPNLVIDGNWGLTRAHQVLDPPSSNQKLASDQLGIPGTNLGDLPVAGGMPQLIVSGYTTLGYNYPYLPYIDPVLQYGANATWIRGSHNVRFGVDLSQQRVNHTECRQPSSPSRGVSQRFPGERRRISTIPTGTSC